jgi:hypothetical protein
MFAMIHQFLLINLILMSAINKARAMPKFRNNTKPFNNKGFSRKFSSLTLSAAKMTCSF